MYELVQHTAIALQGMVDATEAFRSGEASAEAGGASADAYAEAHISNASGLYVAAAKARAASVSAAGEMRARAAALRHLIPLAQAGATGDELTAGGEGELWATLPTADGGARGRATDASYPQPEGCELHWQESGPESDAQDCSSRSPPILEKFSPLESL